MSPSPSASSTAVALLADRTGLIGTTAGLLTGLPPLVIAGYLLVRLLIPVLLIVYATRAATPAQRITLVRTYLTGHEPASSRLGRRRQ
jgi:hypothetical protein